MPRNRSVEIAKIDHLLPVDSQIITNVPVETFGRGARNVYSEFYSWLEEKHPDKTKFRYLQMHNQVYVGNVLAESLRDANRRWLMEKRPGRTKKEIEDAVNYSDLGDGPFEVVVGCNLLGDGGFIVPSTGRSAEACDSDDAWKDAVRKHLKLQPRAGSASDVQSRP